MILESSYIPALGKNNRPFKKKIHVNTAVIQANAKNGTNDPPIIVKERGRVHHCHRFLAEGEVEGHHGLDECGARVWLITYGAVQTFVDPS